MNTGDCWFSLDLETNFSILLYRGRGALWFHFPPVGLFLIGGELAFIWLFLMWFTGTNYDFLRQREEMIIFFENKSQNGKNRGTFFEILKKFLVFTIYGMWRNRTVWSGRREQPNDKLWKVEDEPVRGQVFPSSPRITQHSPAAARPWTVIDSTGYGDAWYFTWHWAFDQKLQKNLKEKSRKIEIRAKFECMTATGTTAPIFYFLNKALGNI